MPKSAFSHIAQRDRFSALDHTDLTEDERQSVIRLALLVLASQHEPRKILSTPKDTCAYLRLLLTDRKNEVFGAIFLDNRHRIITTEELFYGTIDGTTVHPRVVVQRALELNSAALIAFHNHPSGAIEPSKADQTITTRLKEVLALVDIRLLTTSLSAEKERYPLQSVA